MQIPYASYQEELVSLRRYFHIWPELSLEEEQTADYIYQYLQDLKGYQRSYYFELF